MGLLLGDTVTNESGEIVTHIWKASPQIRKDRRKDRVECSSTQMAEVAQLAEQETRTSNKTTRVVGWYHSHPHITALPSHIDVQTQASYQALDNGFVGIIVSCFNSLQASEQGDRIQVIAFQSMQREQLDIGGSDDDAEEDAQMRAALRESRAEAVGREGPKWEYALVPIALTADKSAARDASFHDVVARINSLKVEEYDPFVAEMARLDAHPPPPAELLARTLHCTGVVQQSLAELLQGSILTTLTALHAQLFTISQRRRRALDKLIKYQEAVCNKQVDPNPELDEFVSQQVKHHLQRNDAANTAEGRSGPRAHSVAGASQPQLRQAAPQQQHAPTAQPQLPQQQQPGQQFNPQHRQRQPRHAPPTQQPLPPQQPQQHAAGAVRATQGSKARQPVTSDGQSEVARSAAAVPPAGHSGERKQLGQPPEEPGYEHNSASHTSYSSRSKPPPVQRYSFDSSNHGGSEGHSGAQAPAQHPYRQPPAPHAQQHAQHAQHAQYPQQPLAPALQQLQTASANLQHVVQPAPQPQHAQWAQHGAAAHEPSGSQSQPGHLVYRHPNPAMPSAAAVHGAPMHARLAVTLPMQLAAPDVLPQGGWPAPGPHPHIHGHRVGHRVAQILPGRADSTADSRAPAPAAGSPQTSEQTSERRKWHAPTVDAALCHDFLERTAVKPTHPAVAASAAAQVHPPRGPADVSRSTAALAAGDLGSVAGATAPAAAIEAAHPQNGVHHGGSAELLAGQGAWGLRAPGAGSGAQARGGSGQDGSRESRQAPVSGQNVSHDQSQAVEGAPGDSPAEPACKTPTVIARAPAAPAAGAWGSGTIASKLRGEPAASGSASAVQGSAQPAAATGGGGQAASLVQVRGDGRAAAGVHSSREMPQKGSRPGQKGSQNEKMRVPQKTRGGSGKSGNSQWSGSVGGGRQVGNGRGGGGGPGGNRNLGTGGRQGGRGRGGDGEYRGSGDRSDGAHTGWKS